MKPLRLFASLLLVISAAFLSGCITKLNSEISPGTDLAAINKVYVVRLEKDERGVEKLIADRLSLLGKQATSGERAGIPADVDAIVTYQDKWMWDITMYMIELYVQIRKPKTEIALATGHSMRTSLVRKSPPEMVDEVITDIFKKSK
ncbi:hypothetical protein [Oleiharenicola lentus]|uniref:hypothetical protein n=1 Tax=Oleiharenicola lentus TaxID=2508720 RepID=UPI003F66AA05